MDANSYFNQNLAIMDLVHDEVPEPTPKIMPKEDFADHRRQLHQYLDDLFNEHDKKSLAGYGLAACALISEVLRTTTIQGIDFDEVWKRFHAAVLAGTWDESKTTFSWTRPDLKDLFPPKT